MVYLADVCGGRDNNYNLLRILLASLVVVSHAFGLTAGFDVPEPLRESTGFNLGTLAVFGFFAISGFLITRSFDRTPDLFDWVAARVARIYPGLIVVVLLGAFVLGPAVTALPLGEYFSSTTVYSYVVRHLLMLDPYGVLPGAFADLPIAGYINGPLWTLMYEVICYIGVLVLGLLGLFRHRVLATAVLACLFIASGYAIETGFASVESEEILGRLSYLSLAFSLGVIFYLWRDKLILSYVPLAGAFVATVLVGMYGSNTVFDFLLIFTISYGMFVLAHLPSGGIRAYNQLGDYSYGVYIIGWPIQQLTILITGSYSAYVNVLVALPITIGLAVLSWHYIEKPSLDRRHALADWMRKTRVIGGIGKIVRK